MARSPLSNASRRTTASPAPSILASPWLIYVSSSPRRPSVLRQKIDFTLYNDGSLPVSNVLVRIFAGDPSSSGTVLGETVVAGPIAPASSATGQVTAAALSRDVVVWGVADPKDEVPECNDANNIDQGPALNCGSIILQ
ncbi:MAG: CARDB domain-containing protein [Polyangiaceae bacterium]